ncbi:MAG: HAD family hydrolase [Acidimicrobiia bacterium]|nr:HAD family hydrolase [Acidimicrobiia bacterium]
MRVRVADKIFDIDGIVFDKDGTLIELESYWLGAARIWVDVAGGDEHGSILASALGLDDDGLVADGPLATASIADLISLTTETLSTAGAPDAAERAATAARRAATLVAEATPVPIGGVAEAMRRLDDAGIRLAVATTDERSTTLGMLEAMGVSRLISPVLTGDGEGPFKPDPQVLGSIAELWRTTPDRILMVGDSERDRATAVNGGAAGFVLVADSPRISADATVPSIDRIVPAPTSGHP